MSAQQDLSIARIDARAAMAGRIGRWVLKHWIAIAALSWLLSGALYLTLPPSPDQFNHAYLGWRLLEGDVPYRDFIDMNWPGVMALHALATWLFGINLWSWHALDFLLFAASMLFLVDLVRLAAGHAAQRIAFIALPLTYLIAGQWTSGQHDMSAAQFLVAALWFHVRGYQSKAWWWQLGTGLFIGAAMLNKPTVGVIGVLLPLQALWMRMPVFSVLAHTATAGLAAVATLLVALIAVLAIGGSLQEIVEAVYSYNLATQYVDNKSVDDLILPIIVNHFRWWSVFTLASVPAIFWMLRRSNRSPATTALPVLWLAGILSYLLQRQGYGYHLAPCFLALAGTASVGVALVATGRVALGSASTQRTIAAGFVALLLLGFGYKIAASYQSLPLALARGEYAHHLARYTAGDGLNVADVVAFIPRLEALPQSGCVLVVGTESAINYLSRRREPTRFYYFPVIDRMRAPLPRFERWLDLWEQDLKGADCRFAVVARWVLTKYRGPMRAQTALRAFLAGYRETGVLGANGAMVVYERR